MLPPKRGKTLSATAKATPVITLTEIDQAFGGGFFSGITRDPDSGKRYLNITAGAAHELEGALGEDGVKIEGADSFTNSCAYTEAMAAASSELAQKVLAMDVGGFTDWAIPARDVQELQYRHFKPSAEASRQQYGRGGDNPNSEPRGLLNTEEFPAQTELTSFQIGGVDAFKDTFYWSSSQCSAYETFYVSFDDGYQSYGVNDFELRVRPVRSCPIFSANVVLK